MILADTNGLIWFTVEDPRLGPQAHAIIEQARIEGTLAASAFSFWELAMLRDKDRLPAPADPDRMLRDFLRMKMKIIDVTPETPEIGLRAGSLENFHGDPAARIIVATALEGHQLLTSDRAILNWSGPLQTIPANR